MNCKASVKLNHIDSLKRLVLNLEEGMNIQKLSVSGWPKHSKKEETIKELKKIARISPYFSILIIHGHLHTMLLQYLSSKCLEVRTDRLESNNLRKLSDEEGIILTTFLKSESKPCEIIKISLHFNEATDSLLSYERALGALKYASTIDLQLFFYNFSNRGYSSALREKEIHLMKKLTCSKLTVKEFPGTKRMKNWRYLVIRVKVQVLHFQLVDVIEHFGIYASIVKVVPKVQLNCIVNGIQHNKGLDFKLFLFTQNIDRVVEFNYQNIPYRPFSSLDPKTKSALKGIISFLLKRRSRSDEKSYKKVIHAFKRDIEKYLADLVY